MSLGYFILAVGIILTGLMLVGFTYPELYARFGKFLFRGISHALGRPTLRPEQKEAKAKAKAKKLTPYMPLTNQIEQLTPGQILRFKIRETSEVGSIKLGTGFVNVELNPEYPQRSKKYVFSAENMVNGMPGGKRTIMYVTDEPIKIAASIMDRNGELFVVAEEVPVSAEKAAGA